MANPVKTASQMADSTGKPMIADQQATIADAVVAHSITDVAADLSAANELELEGFLDALGGKINDIIAVLDAHGLTSDS